MAERIGWLARGAVERLLGRQPLTRGVGQLNESMLLSVDIVKAAPRSLKSVSPPLVRSSRQALDAS